MDLAILTSTFPVDDPGKIYSNKAMRRALLEDDWLPVRHGSTARIVPVHMNNELFETTDRIFSLEGPLKGKSGRVSNLLRDRRFIDLEANLHHFRGVYQSILEQRDAERGRPAPESEYTEFKKKYYDYIDRQLADVEDKFNRLYSR